jgi:hypothetical protein
MLHNYLKKDVNNAFTNKPINKIISVILKKSHRHDTHFNH